jgi:integrase
MVAKPLTDTKIRAAKPADNRYRLSDGNGLAVEIMPTGSRYWRYRYEMGGKEYIYALGEWCVPGDGETVGQAAERREAGRFTLGEARLERQRLRDMVKRGQHPIAAKQAAHQARQHSAGNTFEIVAGDFIAKHGRWSASHRGRFEGFMREDVFPAIGSTPIRDVTAADVLSLLRKVEARGALTVAALGRGFIGQVFRHGMATLRCPADPTVALRGALERPTVEHHKPLERAELPGFFSALSAAGANRQTEIAVRLLAYLFVRPGELRHAEWTEINLGAAEWRIDGSKMKMRTAHVVPLPPQAVELLRELHGLTGRGRYLFPHRSKAGKPMGKGTVNGLLAQMGYGGQFSAHGFRATASTMLHEQGFDSKLIELQLAHAERNKSRASYDHSARLAERAAMMSAWADMVDAMAQPQSNVVALRSSSSIGAA